MNENATQSTRYPYTYAADLIRAAAGHGPEGTKLSRSDASRIRQLFARVLGTDDETLARTLADYYLAHQETITEQSVRELIQEMGAKQA